MTWRLAFQALRGLRAVGTWCRGSLRNDAVVARAIRAYLAAGEHPDRQCQALAETELAAVCDRVGAHQNEGFSHAPDAAMRSVVDAMPPLTAAILVLRVHHGMDVDAIVERFAIPRWKIRRHLRRAIRTTARGTVPNGRGPSG
ncbi:sigma-70 family RNA polymerase sigma factor [Sphingobium estronivorans]|uniref:sigma-70 family RNA polymerase sigma factor n=1 Tax=Sphingobium estronivorans TaxID=1577690 RepID=UPI00123A1FF9|nr:sigma-70 family RNA polymerase sigma factor [Sphingobium estronivorans]